MQPLSPQYFRPEVNIAMFGTEPSMPVLGAIFHLHTSHSDVKNPYKHKYVRLFKRNCL
jgi:hypothetical protein